MHWEGTLQAPQMPWVEKALVLHPLGLHLPSVTLDEDKVLGPKGEFLLLLLFCFKFSCYEDLTQPGEVVHASDPHTQEAGADF